jgi:hypothetical protein
MKWGMPDISADRRTAVGALVFGSDFCWIAFHWQDDNWIEPFASRPATRSTPHKIQRQARVSRLLNCAVRQSIETGVENPVATFFLRLEHTT